jgi:hypothetical protein
MLPADHRVAHGARVQEHARELDRAVFRGDEPGEKISRRPGHRKRYSQHFP